MLLSISCSHTQYDLLIRVFKNINRILNMELIDTIANKILEIVQTHFSNKGVTTELKCKSFAGAGKDILSIKINGSYNQIKSLEFSVTFSSKPKIFITGFEGHCELEELENILSEIRPAINQFS